MIVYDMIYDIRGYMVYEIQSIVKTCLLDIETDYGMLAVGNALCLGTPRRFDL